MAEKKWKCFRPGCDYETELMIAAVKFMALPANPRSRRNPPPVNCELLNTKNTWTKVIAQLSR